MLKSLLKSVRQYKTASLLTPILVAAEVVLECLLPFIMAAASQSKEKGMSFSPQETDAIIEVLKMGKSPEEIQRIEKMRSMVQLFLQNQNAKPPL